MSRLSPRSNFRFSPVPRNMAAASAHATGTAYSLTNSSALLALGTTTPSITLNGPGNYLLLGRAVLDYNGATFAASRSVTLKLRRTNNTAADIDNSATVIDTSVVTLLTSTLGSVVLPPVLYSTDNSNDTIQIHGDVAVVPTAGSLDVVEASIIAVKLS